MITEMKPLSMAESKELIGDEGKDKEIAVFIKKFSKLDGKKAGELRNALESLELMKLKDEHIAKIIDLLPEDSSDINKIFIDVSLDEEEINKLLETVKKHS